MNANHLTKPDISRKRNDLRRESIADLHEAAAGQADGLHRADPAPQPPGLRGGQLQGPLRVHRARAEREGQPLIIEKAEATK